MSSNKQDMFSENEIQDVYHSKVKKSSEYFTKYERLPVCPVRMWNFSWSGKDAPRNYCILDFIEWIRKYYIRNVDLGYTCEGDPELEFLFCKSKQFIPYPQFDLHKVGDHFQKRFDFFLFNQTLEHLYHPFLAVQHIFQTLKPGGYVFTSVPTINIPHSMPFHFNGFTPLGLAMLFKTAGFNILETGQWGNIVYIKKLFENHGWPDYEQSKSNDGIARNEERNVTQCWILAQRPN